MFAISAFVAITIIVGCIFAFGWWGLLVIVGIYFVLGVLAKRSNPGKTDGKYGNWR